MKTVTLTIPGAPVPKERPRMTKTGHTYTPKRTKDYEQRIRALYRQEIGGEPIPRGTAVEMYVRAYFPIPKSASKNTHELMLAGVIRPTRRPDADNILKAVADALNTLAYADDSQIARAVVEKRYDTDPRVEVKIKEMIQ